MNYRITAVLLVALAVALAIVILRPQEEEAPPSAPPQFYGVSEEAMDYIAVTAGRDRVEFFKAADGKWHIDSPGGVQTDFNRWGGIPFLLHGPRSNRLVAANATEAELRDEFGLVDAATQIKLGFDNGALFHIHLGQLTPDGGSYYARTLGEQEHLVYLIDVTWGDVVRRLANQPPFPPPQVFGPSAEALVGIAMQSQEDRVEYHRDAAGRWHGGAADGPLIPPERIDEVAALLHRPESPLMIKVNPTAAQVEENRLTDPGLIIDLAFADDTALSVEIGALVDAVPPDQNFAARTRGVNHIYKLSLRWVQQVARLLVDPPYPVEPASSAEN